MMESAVNGAVFLLLGLQLPSIVGGTLHAAGAHWWLPAGLAVAISVGLPGLRWIWFSLVVRGSLQRAHQRGRMPGQPSPALTLVAAHHGADAPRGGGARRAMTSSSFTCGNAR